MQLSVKFMLTVSFILASACAHFAETCEEEVARDHAEDQRIHECRACKPIDVDASGNCPMGYHCDASLLMRSNVLSTGGSECSQLRCADANATLVVGGRLVTKVTCAERQWKKSQRDVAASGVCARRCGKNVCRTLHDAFFPNHPSLLPFAVNAPDADHNCAWGYCADGAMAGDSNPDNSFPGPLKFYCTGDRTWRLPDKNQYDYVACKLTTPSTLCEPITEIWDKTLCDAAWGSVRFCEDPTEHSDSAFTCAPGAKPTIHNPNVAEKTKRFESITCDKTSRRWIIVQNSADGPLTQEELEIQMGPPPYKYSCAR